MTAQGQKPTNLMLRNDTILGVCEALGQDLGINANWFRVAFCVAIYWNPGVVVGVYLALGLVVAATRFAFPDRYVEAPAAAPVDVAAPQPVEIVEERERIAA